MMGTKNYSKFSDLITFSRASGGTALRRISYGDEIFQNSDFDDTSEWTLALSSISISNGKLVYNGDENIRGAEQNVSIDAGKTYQLSFEVLSGTARLYLSTGHTSTTYVSDLEVANYGVGKHVVNLVANGNYNKVGFSLSKFSGGTVCELDYFSLKEVIFDKPDGTLTLFNHPANVPRIEYDAYGNRLGLLIEESRTNLVTNSEDFTDASWLKSNTATLAIDATGPDGETSAVTFVDSGAGGTGSVYILSSTLTVATSSQYTASVYIKADQLSWARISVANFTTPSNSSSFFDLTNGVTGILSGAHDSSSIEDVGNGWYRCSITFTTDLTDTTGQIGVGLASADGVIAVDLDGTSSILIYGAQLEQGSFPTSYIPTSGSTATRSADLASIPVADFGYNQSEGTVVVEWQAIGGLDDADAQYVLGSNSSSARWAYHNSPGVMQTWDGTTARNILLAAADNTFYKISVSTTQNKIVTASNGTLVVDSSTNGNLASLTETFVIAASHISLNQLNGHIKSIKYYPRRLTNAQLVELTS
jgi:hypothetical protein